MLAVVPVVTGQVLCMQVNIASCEWQVACCDLHKPSPQKQAFVHGQFVIGFAMADIAEKVELGLQHGDHRLKQLQKTTFFVSQCKMSRTINRQVSGVH